MTHQRRNGQPPYRRLRLWVADGSDEAVLELPQKEWCAVLHGDRLTRSGQGYCYEGEAFQDEWRFNASGLLTLEIGYDDGGAAFIGDLTEATIERYDAGAGDFTDQPEKCLEFSSINGLGVDIFQWAGLILPDHLTNDASDRIWDRYNPTTLFEMLRSALIEDAELEDGGPPGVNDMRWQIWAMDCQLLKAELRRFLEAHLEGTQGSGGGAAG